MQKLALTGLILVFGAPLLAQSTATSPTGWTTTAGDRFPNYLGRYATGRYQVGDGELKGKAIVISQIDLRLDNRTYGTTTGMGRTFKRATLDMSETNINEMTGNWDKNMLRTPTRVFDSSMTWASQNGRPTSTPWGHVSFPFKSAWTYSGQNGMLRDYTFTGGTLTNGDTRWTGNRSSLYYFDGVYNQDFLTGPGTYMPTSGNTCNDSAGHLAPGLRTIASS